MPIKVRGMTYKPVLLEDLKDAVYFGQVRVYSDEQHSSSAALRAALTNGSLTLVDCNSSSREFRPLSVPNLTPPPHAVPAAPPPPPPPPPAPTMVSPAAPQGESLRDLVKVVAAEVLDRSRESDPSDSTVKPDQLAAMTRAVEDIGRKLESLAVSGPGVFAQATLPAGSQLSSYGRAEEVYIPDIRVDDMSNHISLEARSLGQGGKVNSAIAALKGLQKKNSNIGGHNG